MQPLTSLRAARRKSFKSWVQSTVGQATGVEPTFRAYHRPRTSQRDAYRALVGETAWSRTIETEHGMYDPQDRRLFVLHDAGLYSCLSVALWSLCDLLAEGHAPLNIDLRLTLKAYKDVPGTDAFPALFETPDVAAVESLRNLPASRLMRYDHHAAYGTYDHALFHRLIATYFRANAALQARADATRDRFLVSNARYVGVWYRGTDKATEVLPTDSALYIEQTARLLDQGLADRVLIQTDQVQVRSVFQRVFGERCDVIETLPATEGSIAIHNSDLIRGARLDFARDMVCAVMLLSQMSHVITYTGNIGAWLAFMRGDCRNLWQGIGGVLKPQWADCA